METRELTISEANEYLLGLFRALLDFPKFKSFIDENYIIRQYYEEGTGKILRVEITDKELANDKSVTDKDKSLH